jgi:hypothetical protein
LQCNPLHNTSADIIEHDEFAKTKINTPMILVLFCCSDLGLESCIEHVWKDTIVYLDGNKPILIGRSYGRVHRDLLHEELLRR